MRIQLANTKDAGRWSPSCGYLCLWVVYSTVSNNFNYKYKVKHYSTPIICLLFCNHYSLKSDSMNLICTMYIVHASGNSEVLCFGSFPFLYCDNTSFDSLLHRQCKA